MKYTKINSLRERDNTYRDTHVKRERNRNGKYRGKILQLKDERNRNNKYSNIETDEKRIKEKNNLVLDD